MGDEDMTVVSLLRCSSYEPDALMQAFERSLAGIGFDKTRFSGARVAVKPNLLTVAADESGIITHPEFFRAAVRMVKDSGGTPVLVESPAVHSLARVIQKTGYGAVVREEEVEVADPADVQTLHFEGAKRFKHLEIAKTYFDADLLLCLPKFKTHGITYITGAVKLLFGAIAGMEKSKMHLRLPDHGDFADFLLDLYGAMTHGFAPPKPVIHLLDAIEALEGEGPGQGGRPRRLNAVVAGTDGISVDWAAARVAGLDVTRAPTIVRGFERGFGAASSEDIRIVGQAIDTLRVDDFVPATGNSLFANAFRWPLNTRTFKNLFVERPVPDPDLCTACGQCMKICPAGAIGAPKKAKSVPDYDYGICIRCYCCLEICPEGALRKHPGRLQWLLELIGP